MSLPLVAKNNRSRLRPRGGYFLLLLNKPKARIINVTTFNISSKIEIISSNVTNNNPTPFQPVRTGLGVLLTTAHRHPRLPSYV